MSEVLVCVHDMSSTGVTSLDNKYPKKGDVVVAVPDGWAWGLAELGQTVQDNPNGNHAFFRILKVASVSLAAARTMLAAELPVDPLNPSPFLQYRAKYLDPTKIPTNLRSYWLDDLRAHGTISMPYTAAQFNTIVSVRTVVPWP